MNLFFVVLLFSSLGLSNCLDILKTNRPRVLSISKNVDPGVMKFEDLASQFKELLSYYENLEEDNNLEVFLMLRTGFIMSTLKLRDFMETELEAYGTNRAFLEKKLDLIEFF